MATYRLRHFSNPSTLSSIEPSRLLALLEPYRDFFELRGSALPALENANTLDTHMLVEVFLSPDVSTPRELLDALFLVDEMSTPEGMDLLLDEAARAGHELESGDDHSPADVAVQVWLFDSDILERKHAEQFLFKPKSFEYFKTDRTNIPPFALPSATKRRAIETALDDWFEKKKRGRASRVFAYPKDDEVWFLVRHGQPFKREESLHGVEVESVCYRPLKYDVVVYNRTLHELRINAQLIGEKELYRQQFGSHLFDDPNFFSINKKYTLEPLREYGLASMACGDIDGIESITLTEVHLLWGGAYREIEVRKATDLFAALESRGRELPSHPTLIKAMLKVKFVDCKTPRSVTIKPPNVAQYTRDSDAVILEEWMAQRGFILHEEVEEHAAVAETLAGD
jgi:hypothetical protein